MQLILEDTAIEPRRVFCIGRNYRDHVSELGDQVPDDVIIFMKPSTSLVAEGTEIPVPGYGRELHQEGELVLLIGSEGRATCPAKAMEMVSGLSLGLDMTLRDVQRKLFADARPWELCKSFDGSAPIGRFRRRQAVPELDSLRFTCSVNGILRQSGAVRDMIFSPGQLVMAVSRAWKLLPGDIIYTGTPAGIGAVGPGDRISLECAQLGSFGWRVAGG